MRWLLQELVERTTNAATLVPLTTASVVQTAGPLSGGGKLVGAVTDAATSIVNSVSDAASVPATDLGSTVSASVVEATAKVGGGIKSATAMPTRLGVAGSGTATVGGEGIILSGGGSPELAKHLEGADSMWHGHGRILCVLVVVHLAAFLYWLYLYVISRKLENTRKTEHARRVLKKFKCVYEFAVDRAVELMPKRKRPVTPDFSGRISPSLQPSPSHGVIGGGVSNGAGPSVKNPTTMAFLNKINFSFKGDAP